MSTEIENQVRRTFAEAPIPAGLSLDAAAVTSGFSRTHRRHRVGQALLGGVASLAIASTATWAGGWLPADVQRALPASPWSECPLTWNGSGSDVDLQAVDHAVIPLSGGGTVIAGVARGCVDHDQLFFAATEASDTLPATLPVQSGVEDRPETDSTLSWFSGLRLQDGQTVTAVMVPRGSRDTTVVGPDVVQSPTASPVQVPGTGLDAFVLEDYWPDGEELATVWRDADGLVHTAWNAGITARAWQGTDPSAELTDTWVGQDRQGQHWVMRNGDVQGPFPASKTPYAQSFSTDDPTRLEVVVVLPSADGELTLAEGNGSVPDMTALESQEGDTHIYAKLLTHDGFTPGGPIPDLVWTPPNGSEPVSVPVEHN